MALLASPGPAQGATIFSDGFEQSFSAWTQVITGGDGTNAVQSVHVASGALAAQLQATSSSGSRAYLRKTFSATQQDLTMSADFKVLTEGASNQNVPFFRVFDMASMRLLSLYRQNGTGSIELNIGGVRSTATRTLALNTFAKISLHLIFNGSSGTVEVRLNGTMIYTSSAANLGSAGASSIQVGNDTAAQPLNIVVDTVSVENAAPAEPSPPINTSLPSVSGTPQSGQTLTAGAGVWTGAQPIGYAYRWQRCDAAGSACAAVAGATAPTYLLTSADVARTIRVAVTASNSVGAATATSPASTAVVGPATPPANTTAPTISGTARNGQTLTANPGAWTGTQPLAYAYAWQRCSNVGTACVAIAGAGGATYTLTAADVGRTIRVTVSATNSAGGASATSNATSVVQPGATLPNLVAQWHMDETSGTTMFDSARSHHGTLRSGVQLGQPGFANLAYRFSGSSYVNVPSASDLNPGSANFTVTIRVKTTQAPATPDWDLIRKGLYTTPGGEFKVEEHPSGQAGCGIKGSSGYVELIAGPRINDGVWHTVQCVKAASQIKVVVDGVGFPKSGSVGAVSNTVDIPIGARPGSEYFQGLLDEASLQIG